MIDDSSEKLPKLPPLPRLPPLPKLPPLPPLASLPPLSVRMRLWGEPLTTAAAGPGPVAAEPTPGREGPYRSPPG